MSDWDKYLPAEPKRHTNPFVERAMEEVRIEDVLNDYFKMDGHVPMEARSWKTSCPFRDEHMDGGADKQFRVYSDTNTCHCFESHGTMTTVTLWMQRPETPNTMVAAAIHLLETYGVKASSQTYQERVAEAQAGSQKKADSDQLVTAVQTFLTRLDGYEYRQYDDDVIEAVDQVIAEAVEVCEKSPTLGAMMAWFAAAKRDLAQIVAEDPDV